MHNLLSFNKPFIISLLFIIGSSIHANARGAFLSFGIEFSPNGRADDSIRVIKMLSKIDSTRANSIEDAMLLADSALNLSRSSNFLYGIGNAYIAFATIAITAGNYSACDSFLMSAYTYCFLSVQTSRTNALLALWFQNKGNLAAYTGDYKQAIFCSLYALGLLKEKEYDSTVTALKITLYNDIGSMLQFLKQPDKAISYLQSGLQLAQTQEMVNKTASIYVNLANANRQKSNWKTWRKYLHKAIFIAQKQNDKYVEQVAYISFAKGFLFKNEPDSALFWLEKSSKLTGNVNPYMSQSMPYISLGNYYLSQNTYSKAITIGHEVLKQGQTLGANEVIAQALDLLSRSYAGAGQWAKAYHFKEQLNLYNDSLLNAQKLSDINQLEIKYQVADKNRLIAQQALNLIRQKSAIREKNLWLITFSTAIPALILIIILIIISYHRKQKILKSKHQLARMNALMDGELNERKRIAQELHDGVAGQLLAVKLRLGMALNPTGNQTRQTNIQASNDLLTQAMDDLRTTSQNLSNTVFEKLGFQDAVADYCRKLENTGMLHITFQTYGTAPPNSLILFSAFRIIQELIQNALKHAQASNVLVQLNFRENNIGITVQDDGIGFPSNYQVQKGQGLKNLQSRVKAMNGHLDISSDNNGTCIYIEFQTIN